MAISLIHLSDWLIGLLVDVSLKSVVLAVVAGAGMAVFRVRNSSIRHRVWTAVLAGMLVMPLLAAWAPGVRLPAWAYPDLHAVSVQEIVVTPPINSNASVSTPQVIDRASQRESVDASSKVASSPSVTGAAPPSEQVAGERRATNLSVIFKAMLVACYAVGFAIFGGRLLVGLAAAWRLVRSARAVELSPRQLSAVGATRVVESFSVRVPLTVGWVRPTIVLPSDWKNWDGPLLAAVLAHEQAHVERRDLWVAFVAQVNRVVYWFHPLAWFLVRRLTVLAEAACDDAVIESQGDRTGYARHLLTIAGRLAGRPRRVQPVGVAMAARPAVENRIEAILDDRRPLARRLGWVGSLVLLAVVVPLVLVAGGIRADGTKGGGVNSPDPAAEAASPVSAPVALASEGGTFHLKIVDDNDVPVPEAKVRVRVRQVFMGEDTWKDEKSDKSGELEVKVEKPLPYLLEFQVSKAGYVPFLADWENYESPDPIPAEYTMHLDAARTIGGIVRDENGKPIEGVKVSPFFNLKMREERTRQMGAGATCKTNAAGEWTYESFPMDLQQATIRLTHPDFIAQRATESISNLAKLTGGHPTAVTVMKAGIRFGGRVTDVKGEPIAKAVVRYYANAHIGMTTLRTTTDEEGKFEIGCGEDGEGMLTVAATDHAATMRTVQVTEKTGPTDFQLGEGEPLKVHVVGPDKAPLVGVHIALWNWDDYAIYSQLLGCYGTTDEKGEWEWPHAPAGNLKFAISLKGYVYQGGTQLKPGEVNEVVMMPEAPKEVARHLVRFSGRVLDAATKQPIAKFRTTAGSVREGQLYWNQDKQSEGRDGAYRREFTQHDFAADTKGLALRFEADGYKPAIVQKDLDGKNDFKLDVALEKADAADSYRVVTPSGATAANATVAVCTPAVGAMVQNGSVISNSSCEQTVTDSEGRFSIGPQASEFDLLVLQDSGAAYVTQSQLAKSPTITLEPWARVEGTLKMHGEPAANETITLSRSVLYNANVPKMYYDYRTETDKDGKFAFERVIPGSGQVARVAVTELGGGATNWTPTISSDVKSLPGETTHVELGRTGRQLVGTLVLPADADAGNDWRRATISMQSRPKNAPELKPIPFPAYIDPQKDPKAAQDWLNTWKLTSEGKEFAKERKAYFEAVKGFKPDNFSGRVDADGTFVFDDIPSGAYHLQVTATAPAAAPFGIGPTKPLGTLQHDFTMPDGTENSKGPFDLGVLMLEAVKGKSN